MDRIEYLTDRIHDIENQRQAAIDAMIELSRIHANGLDGVPVSFDRAFGYAEQAAFHEAPEGYLEVTRLLGAACMSEKDVHLKQEFADHAIRLCDATVVFRQNRPDIAYNMGAICEYMAWQSHKELLPQDVSSYQNLAFVYYNFAVTCKDPAEKPWGAPQADSVTAASLGLRRLKEMPLAPKMPARPDRAAAQAADAPDIMPAFQLH